MKAMSEAGLPEPEFEEQGNGFVIELFKKKHSKFVHLETNDLNDRQLAVLEYIKEKETVDNSTYQELCGVTKRTATRDLKELTEKGFLVQVGKTGSGTYYELAEK